MKIKRPHFNIQPSKLKKLARLLPKLSLPKPHLPVLSAPKVSLPKVTIPKPSMPKLFELNFPKHKIPTLSFRIPSFPKPKFSRPQISIPKFSIPKSTFKRPKIEYAAFQQKIKNTSLILCTFAIALAITIMANSINFLPLNSYAAYFNTLKQDTLQKSTDFHHANTMLQSEAFNTISPASGKQAQIIDFTSTPKQEALNDGHQYPIDATILEVEAVLIPHKNTVISSSRDGKIKKIYFDNGELFKKGDTLVEYTCDDARAEVAIAKTESDLAQKKRTASNRLFKLDIISDIERLELETETKQADARAKLQESRLKDCYIRAEYDGRVVKRLANDGEFTRTDRVLLEVASLNTLKAEFLLPSQALRWINIGAPLDITINESEKTYSAAITHIYGEVDPISQSIQITAQLDKYKERLLPGMSGTATLDLENIRRAGIIGFLESNTAQ